MKEKELLRNQRALEFFESLSPFVRETLGIRRFLPPPGYYPPNVAEMGLASHIVTSEFFGGNPLRGTHANLTVMGCWQAMHGWPMYAITPELMEAMLLTEPPGDITWGELQWPMEAATFLLPPLPRLQEYLLTPGIPPAITVGRLHRPPPDAPITLEQLFGRHPMPDGSLRRDVVVLHYYDLTLNKLVLQDLTTKPEWTLDYSLSKEQMRAVEEPGDLPFVDGDMVRMSGAVRLAVNLLAFMSSTYEPKEIEAMRSRDVPERKEKRKKGKTRDALYGVRWLGAGYKLKRPPMDGNGHHASPIWHWKRGHFRHQPYGPGRTMRKTIWIEPYCVGKEGGKA